MRHPNVTDVDAARSIPNQSEKLLLRRLLRKRKRAATLSTGLEFLQCRVFVAPNLCIPCSGMIGKRIGERAGSDQKTGNKKRQRFVFDGSQVLNRSSMFARRPASLIPPTKLPALVTA
jgi:hypothetical protein